MMKHACDTLQSIEKDLLFLLLDTRDATVFENMTLCNPDLSMETGKK